MNYLLEAMSILGRYYTPALRAPDILALGYGDSKTQAAIVGNPPFNATRAKPCSKCLGFKTIMNTDGTLAICPVCNGSGTEQEE